MYAFIKCRVFLRDIDKICELFETNGFVKQENTEEVRERFQTLKRLLEDEYKSRDKVSAGNEMSAVEKVFYFPAIQEAYTRIHVKSNTIPNGKWLMELLDAQNSLKYYLSDLQKMVDSIS